MTIIHKKYHWGFLCILITLTPRTYAGSNNDSASTDLENISAKNQVLAFSSASLFGHQNKDVDLGLFRTANYIAEGKYVSDITVNDRSIGELSVEFKHLDSSQSAVLCIDAALLAKLDLQESYLKKLNEKNV